ncbi:MAG: hypothetical protein JNG89_03120 [Planctomycetaceae bacterium]|nr:hypothetical protein [Planctomycetaceae bacterium]
MDWQLVIVAVLVAAALGVVVRRLVGWLRPATRDAAACGGGCSGCATSGTSPPVVQLQPAKLP